MSSSTQQKKARHASVRTSTQIGVQGGPRTPRLRRVFVRELEIVGSIGVYEHEKRYEQRILISTDLWVRDDYDGVSDKLVDVVDYSKVMEDIIALAQAGHVHLNETLAERIAQKCLADPRVQGVRVEIAKPDVSHAC